MSRGNLRVKNNSLLERNNKLKNKRGNRIKSCSTVRKTTLKGRCKKTT